MFFGNFPVVKDSSYDNNNRHIFDRPRNIFSYGIIFWPLLPL